jgi:hypothetical protein
VAKKDPGAVQKCKACGSQMIVDETTVGAPGDRQIKRVFLHCVNGQCGHIERLRDVLVQQHAPS